ncbi:sulfur carrier protein ThiS [Thermobifida halotolerans]|uniref:Sulfur carrier protein ThiS n=1 Tax=Thermobifida halotolerans TaxID=483545 RepID=A0A399G0I3_9ACTN|nr:sulfur carrier protein ThiS [Thermobifida halotolerans]UOE20155.1 sulfur carrier protein ThiS [Thermobifida halotolerans]
MNAIINGEERRLDPDTTVADVVRSLTSAESGVAVALNDDVVPRTAWAQTVVSPGDRVDVLTAVQGG